MTRSGARRRRGPLWRSALLAAALPAATAAGAAVELELDPADGVVHQQLVLRLRIAHPLAARPSWEAPAFEGFWAERLASVAEPMQLGPDGERLRTTVFRRALFPSRAGVLEIPDSKLRWETEGEGERVLPVPGLRVRVRPLPTDGRPEAFAGIVGELHVEAHLSASQVAQDRPVRLTLEYYGEANLWDAPLPEVEGLFGDAIEVFPERPYTTAGERDGRFTQRRTLRFDLVPRERGRFVLPAFALHYFDPRAQRYRTASSARLEFEVLPPGRASRVASPRSARAAPPPPEVPWLLLGLAAIGASLLTGSLLNRWWRRARRSMFGPPPPSPRLLFERAAAAVGSDEFPERLGAAIKAGIHARHHFDPIPLTSDEIEGRILDPEAIRLLRALDAARFSGEPNQPEALLAATRRYLGL